jgi:DNA mismatch repair protein MutH
MERAEATVRLEKIIGRDLRKMADKHKITVFKGGKKNKGWAGHIIERYLGLPPGTGQNPNFGTWELKVISLKTLRNGELTVKETMAITMINPKDVRRRPFENSHLKAKMDRILIVARIWENQQETRSILHGVYDFDLDDPDILRQVKADYDLVRNTIIRQGFSHLTGEMGEYIQPRTKGPGHGSISRAFYARTGFLKKITGLR